MAAELHDVSERLEADDFDRLATTLCEHDTAVYDGSPNARTIRLLFHELSHKLSTADHAEHQHLPLRGHAWLEDEYHLYTSDGWAKS